jgi:hypothetical protein
MVKDGGSFLLFSAALPDESSFNRLCAEVLSSSHSLLISESHNSFFHPFCLGTPVVDT